MKPTRLALAVPAVLLVAACGATSSHDKSVSSPAARQADSGSYSTASGSKAGSNNLALAPDAVPAPELADGSAKVTGASATSDVPRQTQSIISKGQISLRSKDITKTRFTLQKLLDGWDGTIANDKADADKQGHTAQERLELRIPSGHFSDAMDAISRLGALVDSSRTSTDVTTQVIDNNVRVRTQKLSIARIQALLSQATTLNQVISIENQLSQRQADLDSLEQQQKYLADQTALSTVTVYLTTPAKAATTPKKHHKDFFSGFRSGWHHLGTSTAAVLTGIGAVLPFAALVAVIGLPVWVLRRRRMAAARA
jgi:hypothetical protein